MKKLIAMLMAVLFCLTAAAGALAEENRIWQLGDRGEDVAQIQTRLRELGYLTTEPTGVFDDDTEAALRRFQRDQGLLVTGMADRVTVELLNTTDRKAAEETPMEDCEWEADAAWLGFAPACGATINIRWNRTTPRNTFPMDARSTDAPPTSSAAIQNMPTWEWAE